MSGTHLMAWTSKYLFTLKEKKGKNNLEERIGSKKWPIFQPLGIGDINLKANKNWFIFERTSGDRFWLEKETLEEEFEDIGEFADPPLWISVGAIEGLGREKYELDEWVYLVV